MEEILYDVVGYTSKTCTCIDAGRPNGYLDSLSGLFVDEGEHGIPLLIPVTSCGDGSIWDLLTRARTQAAIDMVTFFAKEAHTRRNAVLDGKTVDIGEKDYTYFKTPKAFNGVYLKPKVYKGVELILNKITLKLDKDANVTLKVVAGDTEEHSNVIAVTGNTDFDLLSANVKVKLFDLGQAKNVSIYYSVDNDAKAINNTLHCGCDRPTNKWVKLFTVDGKQVTDEADTKTDTYKTNTASGLKIHGRVECVGMEWITDVEADYWTDSAYGRLIAKTFQLHWALKTIEEILNAGKINFYTTLGREHLYGKRNKFRKLTSELVPLLAAQLPDFLSHCYQCRDPYGFAKSSL